MKFLIILIQFLLGISIIVGIHELGHMLFAKLFGMRVESFMIGFPPKIARRKWGETEYSIGMLPFGGAVKIAGMIDEHMDTQVVQSVPQPWEFRSKPAWQRIIVMLGGIIFNTITGLGIYICLTFITPYMYLSKQEVNRYGILPNEIGRSIGFQEGDKITHINGKDFYNFEDIFSASTLLANNGYYTIDRNGESIYIPIPANFIEKITEKKQSTPFIEPRIPFEIGQINPGSEAEKIGLQVGDHIQAINGRAIHYLNQLQATLQGLAGQTIGISYERNGHLHHAVGQVNPEGKLGIYTHSLLRYEEKHYNLIQAIQVGTAKAIDIVHSNLLGLAKIITGKIAATKAISGPIEIAQSFGAQFNWLHFWNIVGFLSIVLGFTNLLPIPALDGGHVVLITYELVTGRKVPENVLLAIQKVGLVILVLLSAFAILNDVRKIFF